MKGLVLELYLALSEWYWGLLRLPAFWPSKGWHGPQSLVHIPTDLDDSSTAFGLRV